MKTNKQNNKSELQSQSEQLNNNTNTSAARQAVETAVARFSTPTGGDTTAKDEAEKAARVDSRLPIDSNTRKANRTLPTPKVLNLLLNSLPDVYRLAEVVGKWVWVQFKEQPAAEIRQQLAQLGFHWNRERQAWQHPCGNFRLSSSQDPHERYESYFPARIRRNSQPATQAAA